jgi:prepilin signal peptidase PulO-like enzyme (type II secretory pathway)
MSGLDLFAWVVLIVLLGVTVFVVWLLGSLPGHVAQRRGHPWADAVSVAGWVTLIFGFVLWPLALIWAYVDIPGRRSAERSP